MPVPEVPVEQLVGDALVGDIQAKDQLCRVLRPIVMSRLQGIQGWDNREDLCEDVLVAVATKLETLKDQDRFHGWLAKIIRNVISSYRRKSLTRSTVSLDDPALGEFPDPRQSHPYPGDVSLELALARLPAKYRQAVVLSGAYGLTPREIADYEPGVTVAAVRKRIERGRHQIKEAYRECQDRRNRLLPPKA